MALKIDLIAAAGSFGTPKKTVQADCTQGGGGSESGNMAADARRMFVVHERHRHGVPADQTLDAPFDLPALRKRRLLVPARDRVDIEACWR